jgi:mannose-6-phosphate isomerase-like protein (cupin superfamily)
MSTMPSGDSAASHGLRGGVLRVADIVPTTGLAGHPGTAAFRLMRPGKDSRWLHLTYNVIEPGGGIDAHYHDGVDADHAYFVIAGTVRARIGDQEYDVGPDELMVFPCDTVHGFTVTSSEGARILRLGAAADGRTSGGSVFVDS